MKKVFVYDFDKTIYNGDSTINFWLYCLKIKPYIIIALPLQVFSLLLYKIHIITLEKFKENFFCYLKFFNEDEIKYYVKKFWDDNENRLFDWFRQRDKRENEIVISASPVFLIKDVCLKNDINLVIATDISYSGRINGLNCKGAEKLRRLNEIVNPYEIIEFYSDSNSDLPLAKISLKSYKVKDGSLYNWI